MRVCTRMHSISIIRYTSCARACTYHILYIPGLWRVLKWDPWSPTVIPLSQCQVNRVSRAGLANRSTESTELTSQNLRRVTLSLFFKCSCGGYVGSPHVGVMPRTPRHTASPALPTLHPQPRAHFSATPQASWHVPRSVR